MQFQDELAAGTVLVRPALQSPDYVTGVSGWAVKLDGSAEFNNVTVRGATTVGGRALYYNGTPGPGTLLASISGTGGTDSYGNSYTSGFNVFGTNGAIVRTVPTGFWGPGTYFIPPPAGDGDLSDYAAITATSEVYSVAGQWRPVLRLNAPASLGSAGNRPSIDLVGPGNHGETTLIHVSAALCEFGNGVSVGGSLTAGNMDEGTVNAVMNAVSFVDVPVVFNKTFPSAPYVVATLVGNPGLPAGSSALTPRVFNITTTGCTIRVNDTNGTARTLTHAVHWHAKS
ncbi:hypothetical protein ACIQMZ_37230 [Streptomyces longwoodensis]|uniref:hypothetical protein n=1 Tax=Streptomyces longwoodensis TaxID=68231 RepID=UPI0038107FCE